MSTSVNYSTAPQKTFCQSGEFDQLFGALFAFQTLCDLNREQHPQTLSALQQNLQQVLTMDLARLHQLERHPCYSRHILGHRDSWVGLACRWEKDASSSIHGHPAFTYYMVIEGSFRMEIFEKNQSGHLRLSETRTLKEGDSVWKFGVEGRYDNLIHRVITEKAGITLQLFSEDPSLGEVFPSSAHLIHDRDGSIKLG